MVKVRLQGTTCEIKRMKRCIERNKRIKVISVSDAFPNKGTKKYFRRSNEKVNSTLPMKNGLFCDFEE